MVKKEVPKVSIVRCVSYKQSEVDLAISRALKLAKIEIPRGKKVLLKPNIVSADVNHLNATITQPQILEAACKILKKNKCKILIGESSFMNTDVFFTKSKIDKIAKKYNAKLVVFEQDKLVKVRVPNGKIIGEFPVSRLLKQADLVINLPKLKTHQLMRMTGAIKNLYGLIPGGLKQRWHRKAPSEKAFGKLMIDIYSGVKDKIQINIMDGIVGMEGKGPTSGIPKKSNMILVSKDAVALDIVASKVMGYAPKKIKTTLEAVKRKLGSWKYDLVLSGFSKLPELDFKKPYVREKLTKKMGSFFKEKLIVCDHKKCIKCGICRDHCPTKAITLKPFPIIDKRKCIRCFCCMEICPKDALSLKE